MFNKQKFSEIFKNIYNKYDNQRDFAQATEVNRAYISQYMNMKLENPPTPKILKRIADNSKGITTYDELMEVCGYIDENIETYTYDSVNRLKKFETFVKDKNNDPYCLNVEIVVQDFIGYLDNLKDFILGGEKREPYIFSLHSIYKKEHVFEEYCYIAGFLILYEDFLKYFVKQKYLEQINYHFVDWFEIENIYNLINNSMKTNLIGHDADSFKLLLENNFEINNLENLADKIQNYSNCINLSVISSLDNNLLSEFFKYKVQKENQSDSVLTVAEDSVEYRTKNNETIKIPVVGTVAAGEPILAEQNIIDYEELPEEEFNDGSYFGLKVKGDSMFPRILEGDVVIVKQQDDCESGQVAVILINGDEATVKQVKKMESGIMLMPYNATKYQPTFYTNEEIQQKPVKIIGIVKRLIGYNFD